MAKAKQARNETAKAKQARNETIDKDMLALNIARKQIKQLTADADAIQKRIVQNFYVLGLEEYTLPVDGGFIMKCKRYVNESITINEAGLQKALGAKLWKLVTTTVVQLDKKKLNALIADETIDATVVAQNSITTPSKPFVKVTVE